ncbi:MAG: hypothetical protein U1D55_08470 [Phycisphaerae bacterium]
MLSPAIRKTPLQHADAPVETTTGQDRRQVLAKLAAQIGKLRCAAAMPRRCSSGLPALDEVLGGGFLTGGIYELLAPALGAAARSLALCAAARAAGGLTEGGGRFDRPHEPMRIGVDPGCDRRGAEITEITENAENSALSRSPLRYETVEMLCPSRDREGAGVEKAPFGSRKRSFFPAPSRSRLGQAGISTVSYVRGSDRPTSSDESAARGDVFAGSRNAAARWLAYIDSTGDLYPPAAAQLGAALSRMLIVRAAGLDACWACEQLLRCRVFAAVLFPTRSIDVQTSRRLQLAAEAGGGLGLLICTQASGGHSFAAGRLLFEPLAGETELRRMKVTVLKLRERRPPAPFVLELSDAPGVVPAYAALRDRPGAAQRGVVVRAG